MKLRFLSALALACALAGAAVVAQENKDEKKDAPKVSSGESSAAQKLNKAKGAEAKLQAGAEFVKKYPQSPLRKQVVEVVAGEIINTQDAALKASLAEAFKDIFTGPGEADQVAPVLLDAYIVAGRNEEAFRAADAWLAKNPDDVDLLRRLATVALNASISGNNAFVETGRQHGAKALALIEADKRPATVDATQWAEYKTRWLPVINRELGILAFREGDKKATRTYLSKAAELRNPDPAVYLILSDLTNEEYDTLAKEARVAPAAEQPAARKKAEEALDRVIESYARAMAVIEGNAQYDAAREQLGKNLETYYKFRHGGKTDGLQQLIDKYKKP